MEPENDGLEFGRWFSSSRGVFSGSMLIFRGVTKNNIASENEPSQKEASIPTIHFQVRTVSLREGINILQGTNISHHWRKIIFKVARTLKNLLVSYRSRQFPDSLGLGLIRNFEATPITEITTVLAPCYGLWRVPSTTPENHRFDKNAHLPFLVSMLAFGGVRSPVASWKPTTTALDSAHWPVYIASLKINRLHIGSYLALEEPNPHEKAPIGMIPEDIYIYMCVCIIHTVCTYALRLQLIL